MSAMATGHGHGRVHTALACACALAACGGEPVNRTRSATAGRDDVGGAAARVDMKSVALFDTRSRESVSLASLAGAKGTAIFFTANTCPVARAYEHSLSELIEKLQSRGVALVAVNSNYDEAPHDIRLHVAEA